MSIIYLDPRSSSSVVYHNELDISDMVDRMNGVCHLSLSKQETLDALKTPYLEIIDVAYRVSASKTMKVFMKKVIVQCSEVLLNIRGGMNPLRNEKDRRVYLGNCSRNRPFNKDAFFNQLSIIYQHKDNLISVLEVIFWAKDFHNELKNPQEIALEWIRNRIDQAKVQSISERLIPTIFNLFEKAKASIPCKVRREEIPQSCCCIS